MLMTTKRTTALSRCVSSEIRVMLAARRLSGAKFAVLVNMSQNYLAQRLRDERDFTLDDIDKIASHFGIDAAALIVKAYDDHSERVLSELAAAEHAPQSKRRALVVADDAVTIKRAKAAAKSRRSPRRDEPS